MNRQPGFPIVGGTRWVLLAGFGGLLLLLVALGYSSIVALDRVERADREETRRFIAHAGAVHQLRDRLSAAFSAARNYLLDRDRSNAGARRTAFDLNWKEATRASLASQTGALPGQGAEFAQIEDENARYLRDVVSTFEWSPAKLDASGYDVLSRQLDPGRSRILAHLDEVRRIDEDHLRSSFAASNDEIAWLKARLRATIAAALALGLSLAAFSIWHVVRLERVAQHRYQALTGAYQEQGRLAKRVIEVQELERKNLARELHDEVSQSLGAMLVDLGSVSERSGALDSAKHTGQEVLNAIRNICLLLRPSMLDDLGLIAALHWQARETLRRYGIRVVVTADDADLELPDALRTAVYRVVQEALRNVVRHSGACQAEIVIRREHQRLAVIIQDDGRGFNPELTRGLGVLGMQERVTGLKGTLQINSEPGKGTILNLLIPLNPDEALETAA